MDKHLTALDREIVQGLSLTDPQCAQVLAALPGLTGAVGEPCITAPLTRICPNHRYCLLDDGMGELAFVSNESWEAAHYHATTGEAA